MLKHFLQNHVPIKKLTNLFLIILILGGLFASVTSILFYSPVVVYAETPKTTSSTLSPEVIADIEKQVQAEYDKVYAAEIKKKTSVDKAKKIAQAAADKKRTELTAAAKASNDPQKKAQEAAGYVARTYDGADWEGSLTINNPTGKTDIAELITKLINWLLLIIGMVATAVIIISGIMLVFNSGSEATIKKAKTTILWAVLGLVISIGAFALVNIIQSLL